jgi:flagellar hook-basal body complex protein FliE
MSTPITPISPSTILPVSSTGTASSGAAFGAIFQDAVSKVEQLRTNATQSVERFLSGEGEELHQTALATQKAEIAFELFTQVRNKVVQAYQEIMRMQI